MFWIYWDGRANMWFTVWKEKDDLHLQKHRASLVFEKTGFVYICFLSREKILIKRRLQDLISMRPCQHCCVILFHRIFSCLSCSKKAVFKTTLLCFPSNILHLFLFKENCVENCYVWGYPKRINKVRQCFLICSTWYSLHSLYVQNITNQQHA